jgi:hypothetical protein
VTDPQRAAAAAREEEHVRAPLVHPGGGHRAAQLLERLGPAVRPLGQREDRSRVDGHVGLGANEPVAGENLLVVHDDSVVDADHAAVAEGMVVRLDLGVTLGVVTHVDKQLCGVVGDADTVEERARTGALLVDRDAAA